MPSQLRGSVVPVFDPVLTGVKTAVPPSYVPNPFAVFNATYAGGSSGVQVAATIGTALQAVSIHLLRGSSLDSTQATLIQTWNGPFTAQQQLEYTDSTTGQTATALNYWLEIVYSATPPIVTSLFGPQTAYISATVTAGSQIPAFSVSVSPAAGAIDNIGISFELPDTSDFGSVDILVSGYNGIGSSVLVAQSAESPFSFPLKQTGETVKFQCNAVSVSGSPTLGGPTATVTLNALATVPCVIYDAEAVSLATGNQITFAPGPETNLTNYLIYRAAAGGDFASATLLATVPAGAQNNYVFTDTIASPQSYCYFIVAQNATGNSPASPVITPGQSYTAASQGSGGTGLPLLVANGANYVVAVTFVENPGENYYQQPTATWSGSSLGTDATGTVSLDGDGHLAAFQMTSGGVYAETDTPAVTIGY